MTANVPQSNDQPILWFCTGLMKIIRPRHHFNLRIYRALKTGIFPGTAQVTLAEFHQPAELELDSAVEEKTDMVTDSNFMWKEAMSTIILQENRMTSANTKEAITLNLIVSLNQWFKNSMTTTTRSEAYRNHLVKYLLLNSFLDI